MVGVAPVVVYPVNELTVALGMTVQIAKFMHAPPVPPSVVAGEDEHPEHAVRNNSAKMEDACFMREKVHRFLRHSSAL
jgi:hypothetical protein